MTNVMRVNTNLPPKDLREMNKITANVNTHDAEKMSDVTKTIQDYLTKEYMNDVKSQVMVAQYPPTNIGDYLGQGRSSIWDNPWTASPNVHPSPWYPPANPFPSTTPAPPQPTIRPSIVSLEQTIFELTNIVMKLNTENEKLKKELTECKESIKEFYEFENARQKKLEEILEAFKKLTEVMQQQGK